MRKFVVLATAILAAQALADIPDDIDSSGWDVNPEDYGMTAKEYIQADSRAFFANFLGRSAVNEFYHLVRLKM